MKQLKRITALMAALLITVNIFVINVSAVMAAPVVAEELAEILVTLLAAAGHSQSEIDGMSITDMQSTVVDDLNSGKITIDTTVIDPVSGAGIKFIEFMNNPENKVARDILSAAMKSWASDWKDGFNYIFEPTSTFNFNGNKSFFDFGDSYGGGCEYIIVDTSNPNDVRIRMVDTSQSSITGYTFYDDDWHTCGYGWGQGWKTGYKILDDGTIVSKSTGKVIKLYGDVRTIEGENFPTDDAYEYPIGEAAGTKVTPDMLNPDGTVTIDGVTYNPVDYCNPDNLTDTGKKQLINNISFVINNTYVISDNKPIVDDKDITVDVPEELQDYAVPVGIANVFPFCIPWDIVRGFRLLNRPVVAPKFEIPFTIPEFGLFPGIEESITLDFSKYDTYIQIFRWFQILGFSFLLCRLSMTRVKGAGA